MRCAQSFTRHELRFAAHLRILVPGANRETVVAAINAIAHQRTELARNRTLVLDGEVGDAAPRVQAIRRRERGGWADVEAGAAASAVIGLVLIGWQLERGEDRTQEQPRAELSR